MHTLTLLLLTPLLGALIVALLPGDNRALLRGVAIAASGLAVVLAWSLLWRFDSSLASMQFSVTVPWNPRLGSNFALGIDGISFPMVLLATDQVLASGTYTSALSS